MKIFRVLLACLFCVLLVLKSQAQDPLFSQFYNVPSYINPAHVGLAPGLRAKLTIRDQWPQLPGELRNYMFSMDFAERNIPGSGGLGLVVMNENAGTGYFKTSMVGVSSAVRIPLSRQMVSQIGFTAAFVQKTINWDNLVFTDQLDAVYGNVYESSFQSPTNPGVFYPDFSVGGVFRFTESSSKFSAIMGTLGVAVHHLFTPNESFLTLDSPLPQKISITGDLVLEMDNNSKGSFYKSSGKSNNFKFNPGFIYETQADFSSYSVGVNILKSSIYCGTWLRNRTNQFSKINDLIFLIGLNAAFNDETRIKINYSYDFVLNGMQPGTGGSHEISLIFELDSFTIFSGGGSGFGMPNGNRSRGEFECCPF